MAISSSSPMTNLREIFLESGVTLWRRKGLPLAGGRLGGPLSWRAGAARAATYGTDGRVVAKNVVECRLTSFGEKAASSSRVEMEKAHKFLDDQIAAYEVSLRAAEQRRADFQKKCANYLAEPNSGVSKLQALRQA